MTGYTELESYPDLKGIMLEVGSENRQGSTTWLYNHSRSKGLKFYTVDCSPYIYEHAREICGDCAYLGKGEEFVEQLNEICFAYIDCFDYHENIARDVRPEHHAHYAKFGYKECSGSESVRVNLEIAKKLEERTAKKCVVIFDDTNYQPYTVKGKGAFAVPYLIGRGFKVVKYLEVEPTSLSSYVVLYREK